MYEINEINKKLTVNNMVCTNLTFQSFGFERA